MKNKENHSGIVYKTLANHNLEQVAEVDPGDLFVVPGESISTLLISAK